MASSRLHRSQMTAVERAMAREARIASAGVSNLQGGVSYIRQGHGAADPTREDIANAVQWNRGVELQGHQTFTFGPRFEELLPDMPANAEAAGPSQLHVKPHRG